jgi:hypothetical protein
MAYESGMVANPREYTLASSLEQFVTNNLSDVDSLGYIGSHSNFANQQAGPDAAFDTLTEENTESIATNAEDDYDSYVSDVDSSPDIGLETNPTNAQGTSLDSQYMTLQETDVGDPYQSTWLDTNSYDTTIGSISTVGTSPYLDSQDDPANYVFTKAPGTEAGWWDFPNTTLTGNLSVNVSLYCWNLDGANDDGFDIYYDTTGSTGTLLGRVAQHTTKQYDTLNITGTLTQEQVNALRIRIVFFKTGGADYAYIDHMRIGVSFPKIINNEANFEYNWGAADNDEVYEEVCINVGSIVGSEALNVSYWDGLGWISLGQIVSTGWTNLTATSLSSTSYTIRLRGAEATNDVEQGSWTIDLITIHTWTDQTYSYELDLEAQWTAASFDNNNEYLCIYVGTTDAEDIVIEVWNGGGWINIYSDLQSNSWNNITVKTWLTSSTFTIRFRGGQEIGDSIESQWSIDAALLHTWNNIPSNDQQPEISNIDDGSFMYARAREYLVTANVSDQDGYTDIQSMRFSLYSDDRLTLYWSIEYDEDANLFGEFTDPSNYITLDTVSSTALKLGSDIDITFQITIEWNHPDISNTDAQCIVIDSKSENSTDWYEVDWNIETRLNVIGINTDDNLGTVDRGDMDGQFFTSGTVTYYGSALNPQSTEVDVWIFGSEYGTNIGPWDDLALVSGFFNATCYADDEVGQDTYTIKVVEEGAGSGSSDLLYSSVVDTYIADGIEFYESGVDDSRIDIDTNGVTWWSARYQYDSLTITSGLTATLNGSKVLSWNGSHWAFQESMNTVQAIGYSVASAYEGTHGLGVWLQTAANTTIIWDRIRILTTITQDGRIDYGTPADIRVTAELEYDSLLLGLGDILYMNNTEMTWVGSYFRLQPQFSQVGLWRLYVNITGAKEITYGITNVFLDGNQIDQIWDRILILTTSATDSRIDYGTTTTINVTAQLEYDATLLGSGDSLSMNNTGMTWDSDHFYFETGAYSMVGLLTYFVNLTGALETSFGISVVQSNQITTDVIWDRVRILSTTSEDSRIDIDTFADLRVTAELEYDGHLLGLGDTLYANNTVMTWVDPFFQLQPQFPQIGLWRFYVNTTGVMETTFQITAINLAGLYVDQIWDRIVILTTTTQNARVDFGISAEIRVTAELQFDSHPLGPADTLYMNETAMTWVGSYFRLQPQFSMIGSWEFFVNSTNAYESNYGISALYLNGTSVSQVWDRIEFYQSGVVDGRIDVGDIGLVYWNARYEYDGFEITGGILTALLNGSKALTWNSTDIRWDYFETKTSVQLVGYRIISASEATYGLSSWIQTASNMSIIWDEIEFYSSGIEDDRININTIGTTWWRARYAYDKFEITSSLSALLNGSKPLSWNGTAAWWEYAESFSAVQSMSYGILTASESLFGLTSFNQLATNTSIIWDKITVQLTTVDINHLNVGSTAEIQVKLWLEFDHTFLGVGDSVILNGTAMTWDAGNSQFTLDVAFTSVGIWTFFVNSSVETNFGISELDLNSSSIDVIWDRIIILSLTVDDSRVNVGDTVELQVTAKLEFTGNGDHFLGSGDTLYMEGVAMVWNIPTSSFVHSTTQSSVGLWKYYVNSSNAYETDYGISVVNLNSKIQDVIWDQLVIDIQADAELTLNGQQVNFTLSVTFDYDSVECTTYEIMIARNDTDWLAFTYSNRTLFNDTQSDSVYLYNASLVLSETLYEITLFITNTEAVNWSAYVPIQPVNEAPPNLFNPDDSDNMYGRLRFYLITSNVSDSNGFQDIRYVSLLLYSNDRGTNFWTVKFVRSTSSFTIENGSTYISLGASSFEQAGNWLNITWYIKISWDHPDLVDVDTKQFVSNTFSTASDWYESDWDIETRLDYSSSPSLSDDHGDVDTADLDVSGGLTYFGSILYPRANETDFWALHDISGSWSGEVDGLGGLSIVGIGSSSSVRINTYTFKVVAQGDGSSGTDLYYTASVTDSFITDRIEFYESGEDDGRINVGSTGTTYWTARFDYDDTTITSGLTAFLTGSKSLSWNGTHWVYSEIGAAVGLLQYSILSASETLYGLTAWIQTAADTSIIWDRILITLTDVDDNRVNINSGVELWVTAQLEYDGHPLGTLDTLYLDDVLMTWDNGDLRFELSRLQASVGSWRYFVNISNAQESTYEITAVNQNGNFQDIIWDRISVQLTVANDSRVNVDELVEIRVTLMLEHDATFLSSGDTVILAGLAMTWEGDNSWYALNVSKSSVGMWTYYVNSSVENAYSITELYLNSKEVGVVWDRIRILSTSAADGRIDYGTSTAIRVTAELEYDGHVVGIGDILYANNTLMSWNVDHFEFPTGAYSMVGLLTYFVNSSSALESTYGITLVNPNSQAANVIWDRIRIITTTTQDDRIDFGSAADFRVTALLEYDSHSLESGDFLYMDDTEMTWVSTYFQYQPIRNEVGSWRYFVNITNAMEASYGISVVNLDGKAIDQIWDQILILTTTTQDGRVNYNSQADIRVTAILEFDSHQLGLDDTLYMNGSLMTWIDPYFQFQPQYTQVGEWVFFVNSTNALEDTYGISYVSLGGNSVAQIWDRIQIVTTTANDNRLNYGTIVTISVTAQLEYDGHALLAADTLYLDNTQLVWNTDHYEHQTSKSAIGLWRYYVNSSLANEVTYGISSLNPTILWTDVIWDRILILTTSTADDHIDYASSTTITVTAALEYDNHPFDTNDILYLDNVQMTWNTDHFEYLPSKAQVGLWRYFVNGSNALEDTYGITLVNLNSQSQDVIWDRIEFYQSGVVDGRIDVNSVGETWWRVRYQYDGVEIDNTKGLSAALNGSKIMIWDGAATRWRYQETSPTIQSIGYQITLASEMIYGLSAWTATTSDTGIIWDQLLVVSYSIDDSRIDIDTPCFSHVTLIFDFDDSFVIDGAIWVNGVDAEYTGSNGVWDFNETRSVAQLITYNSVTAAANEHGITSVNQNSQTLDAIWDSLTVTITVDDSRINVGDIVSIVTTAVFDYDSSAYDGTLQLNDTTLQQFSPSRLGYTVETASGGSYGITAIRQNMEVYCIWDSLTVTITAVDYRINVGNLASISASAVYDYDSTLYDGSLTLNDTMFQQGSVGDRAYTVESVNGDTHGITVISINDVIIIIWDRLRVLSYSVTDARCNLGSIQEITALVIREYDSVLFTGAMGTVFLNGSIMAWDSIDLVWTQLRTNNSVTKLTFNVNAITDTQFGISALNAPGGASIIWDALSISITIIDDRINIGDTASVNAEATYIYDSTMYDGTLTLNDTVFVHGSAERYGYTVSTANGDDTYGITFIDVNDEVYCIWDSLTILITNPLDQRIDVDTNASGIIVSATYDYDNVVYDGSLVLNNTVFTYSTAQKQGYEVLTATGDDSYGITVIQQNWETYCIWDSLTIDISDPPDQRINIGENATGILVSATYDYDGLAYDGTLVLNDTQFLYSSVGKRGYKVLAANGDDGNGISAISTPDETYCIWDRLRFEISVDGASLYNGQQANFTLTVRYDYDFSFCSTYEVVISRNESVWYAFTDGNKSLFQDINTNSIYFYNASLVNYETQYGITVFITTTQKVTWSEAPNQVPVNESNPLAMLDNADDSDNMYAMYKYYVITSNVSDGNGYDKIDFVELSLYDNFRIQVVWTLRYTVLTDTFSIQQGAGTIILAAESSASGIGNQLEITWIIKIQWNHTDLTEIDIRQYVTDGIDTDEDYYEVDWDVETRLDITGLTISDGSGTDTRGPLDGSFTVTGTILYLGSGDDNPLSNETDVWVLSSEYGSFVGPWSDLTLVSGLFSLTAFADNAVGSDLITIKAVEEGSGSGGSDLFSAPIQTTYISDRVLVQFYSPDDNRVNVDDSVDLDVSLTYASDSSPVIDGTVTINSIPSSHIGAGVWRITISRSSVQEVLYNNVAYSGGAHGLIQVDQNGQSQNIIWDSLTVTITGPNDNRLDILENASDIFMSATYDFDNADYDGTLVLNNTVFLYGIVQKQGYTVLAALGDDTHGITLISQNSVVYCIWDSLTISITNPLDQRVNIGANASGIVVTAVYDYDNSSFDGTLTLNNSQFVYGSAQRQGYRVQLVAGGIHGITAVSTYNETFCIWDALIVSISDPFDQRIDVNQNASGIVVSARYDYDNSLYSGTLILNNTNFVSAVPVKRGYTVLSALGDDAYGITNIITNSETWCIWDQIVVLSYQASDERDNVGDYIWADVTLEYDYDDTRVVDGSVTINGYTYQHLGLGVWRHNRTELSVTDVTFDLVSCTGNNYGIQEVNQNSQSLVVVWDRLTVTIAINDRRIDVDSIASILASAVYDYDGQSYDGILTLNDTVHMHGNVGRWAYTVISASGDSFDISLIGSNDEDYVIWDRLRILSYWIDEVDGRTNIGTIQQVYVTVDYEYDGTVLQGAFGTVFMNSSAMTWNPALLRWNHSFVYLTPVGYTFQVSEITDLLHGLTAISEQVSPESIIWDKLNVVIQADTSIAYYGEIVSFTVTATRQYDNSRVSVLTVETLRNSTPPVLFDNFTDTWNGPEDALQQYLVDYAEDGMYGITEFDTLMIAVFWTDAPLVIIDSAFTSDTDGRVNIGTTISIYFHCVWLENGSDVETGLLYVNSTPHSINETGWVKLTDSSPIVTRRAWIVTGVSVDGVSDFQFDVSAPAVIWDSIRIDIHLGDERINVGELANITVDGEYSYDGLEFDGVLALNDTILRYSTVGKRGFTVSFAAGGVYGITILESNQEVGVIWDGLVVTLSVDYHRVDVGMTVSIQKFATYAFDGAIFDGTLTLNDTVSVQSFIGMRGYEVESAEGGIHDIWFVISNDETFVIWDVLEVYWSQTERARCDLGASVQVRFKIRYSFDESSYTDANGSLMINGTEATFDSSNGFWFISVSSDVLGSFTFSIEAFDDQTSGITNIIDGNQYVSIAVFDSVYVSLAGVRGTDVASNSVVDVLAPHTLSVLLGSEVTIYFQLRYLSDGEYIVESNTILTIKGQQASYDSNQDRWEIAVTSNEIGIIEYLITSFEDQYGLTEVDQTNMIPRVEWSPTVIPPEILYIVVGGIASLAVVVFIARTRKRVTTLEHALTPEELLSLGDVGITSELRGQIVNQLEWLRDLSEEIPYIGNDVLSVLNEELTRAKQMYVKAFELEPPTEPAGMQLKEMLLQRIESILESIEMETQNRS